PHLLEAGPTMGALSAKGVPLALACWALPILSGVGLPTARAQADVSSTTAAFNSTAVADPPPPAIVASGLLEIEERPAPSCVIPGSAAFGPDRPPARVATGPLDVIRESIFGAASEDDWRPLGLSTFFTRGWDEPWVKSPPGTNGAPKQNWFGAADGVFARLSSLNFFYTNGMTTNTGLLLSPFPWSPVKPETNGNQYWASCNVYLPLNQRLELLVV